MLARHSPGSREPIRLAGQGKSLRPLNITLMLTDGRVQMEIDYEALCERYPEDEGGLVMREG